MAMADDILIYRDFQIIAGYVQVPNNAETDKTRVTTDAALAAIAGSAEVILSAGSGKPTGSKSGAQRFLRLPGLAPGSSYSTDPVEELA